MSRLYDIARERHPQSVSFRVHLVLASTSPRRAELLTSAGFTFSIHPVDIDESGDPDEPAEAYVRRIAIAKAVAAGPPPAPDAVILTADTVVVLDGLRLGKPVNSADAASMLARLSGRTHEVLTAIALSYRTARTVDVARTRVTFNVLPAQVIDWYVASREPHDKAGAYAIQGLASRFVERIEGSYTNVVGLPVDLVYRHLLALDPMFALGGAPA
jgi:septum formation protein